MNTPSLPVWFVSLPGQSVGLRVTAGDRTAALLAARESVPAFARALKLNASRR